MSLTLAAAAAAVNVNKTTLLRAIKAGKVSGNRDERGQWHIDDAELHRVYPPAAHRCDVEAPQRDAVALAMVASEVEIAGLRQVAELLRAQLQVTRTDRGSRG